MMGILEIKFMQVWRAPLKPGFQEFFSLQLVHTQMPAVTYFYLMLASVAVSVPSMWISLYLADSSFGGGSSPYDLNSLMHLRRVLGFLFFPAFSLNKDESGEI